MRYLTLPAARFRRGSTAYAVEQDGVLKVMHSMTYLPEPEVDDTWDALLGWAIMAFLLVLGIAIGWLT